MATLQELACLICYIFPERKRLKDGSGTASKCDCSITTLDAAAGAPKAITTMANAQYRVLLRPLRKRDRGGEGEESKVG